MPPFEYPAARRADVVDDYHGVGVPDPYRWLEDPDADETRAFVRAQNAITMPYLHGLPEREALRRRMAEIWDVPRSGLPDAAGGRVVWSYNDGLLDQPRFLVLDADADEPRVLLDPNMLSEDGAVAVVTTSLSPDGTHLAYSVAEAGSDWQIIRIRDVATGEDLPDELHHVKFTSVAWNGDGFFYARFPEQDHASTEPSRNMSVHRHALGTDQADDTLVHADPDRPDLGFDPAVSDDGRYLVLTEWDGTSIKNGLLVRPVDLPDTPFTRIVEVGVALHGFLDHVDGDLLVHTDLDSPNGRIVRIPIDGGEPTTVVGETAEAIETATVAAGRIGVVRLRDASHTVELFTLAGTPDGTVPLPGPGTVEGLSGRRDEPDLYLAFQSFLHPPSALRWREGRTERFSGSVPPVDPEAVTIERRTAVSTDGAAVGMFVVAGVGTSLPAPTELYGYGGFNINLTPTFHPGRLAFLEAGGVVAVANLRGGSELGERWHEQGMLGNKQQVFDDFIACAEMLIADGVATSGSLGIRGGSNGGLLTAAVVLQRPELFGAVVSQVPVADMLRYQHFTAGRYWTVEYGDAGKDPDAFRWLLAYSPYHNVRDGVDLPPLLITTAETDDRVVPMHGLKLAAAVQHAAGGRSERPLLVRVETRAGHGLGKPTGKLIDESADLFGFLLHHLRDPEAEQHT